MVNKLRHPEKINLIDKMSPLKPDWIKVRFSQNTNFSNTKTILKKNNITTVCEEAGCPNIGECWTKKHATFMIMGDVCTRACAFCNVITGKPKALYTNLPKSRSSICQPVKLARCRAVYVVFGNEYLEPSLPIRRSANPAVLSISMVVEETGCILHRLGPLEWKGRGHEILDAIARLRRFQPGARR